MDLRQLKKTVHCYSDECNLCLVVKDLIFSIAGKILISIGERRYCNLSHL